MHPYPTYDFNHDCRVDFEDLATLQESWLECTNPYPIGDLNGDCYVNFEDFAMFAAHWMECTRADGCN